MTTSFRTVYAFAREMHPKTEKADIQYGTAGFRLKASKLGYVMYRMGLLAVLRARYLKATVGVMITASHNPEPDNGVKLVDPAGEMLEQSWEAWATRFANVGDDQLERLIKEIVQEYDIDMNNRVEVYVGKDTRPSSPSLAKSLMDGVLALSGKPIDFGIVTTPQLHYFVKCRNDRSYGTPTEEGYYTKLASAFKKLRGDDFSKDNYENVVYYDGANGVGAKKIKFFQERIGEALVIKNYNDEIIGSGKLNYMCGADFVKTKQQFPNGLPSVANARCVSVDGDADRVMYYYVDDGEKMHVMDGDRIATLVAAYIKELVSDTGIDLNLGLVQTAYANAGSTNYIREQLKVPVECVQTGVKHLHHKALQFDIGVYFEANGHGTVVFSVKAKQTLKDALENNSSLTDNQKKAVTRLQLVIDLINETVGDAISDMLLVETILHERGWSIQDWEQAYEDLPYRLLKVAVADRNLVTTADAERVCVTPNGLQAAINALVAKYRHGRAFVRASGTEDVVRVYAEAATHADVDRLSAEVARQVYELADGVGALPEIPA